MGDIVCCAVDRMHDGAIELSLRWSVFSKATDVHNIPAQERMKALVLTRNI